MTDAVRVSAAVASAVPLLRIGLRRVLEEGGIAVVGEAADAAGAAQLAARYRPDVLVLDVSLPPSGGIDVARRVKAALPRVGVVLVSQAGAPDRHVLLGALGAGVNAWLDAGAAPSDLAGVVRACASGDGYLHPGLAAAALRAVAEGPLAGISPTARIPAGLTPREWEAAKLAAMGLTNEEIAQRLVVSRHTVKNLLYGAMKKLGVRNRTELALRAAREGWAPPVGEGTGRGRRAV